MFWDVTLYDIKTKIRLHNGHQQALIVQQFQTLEKVVSIAFGSGDKTKRQLPPETKTKAELKSKFKSIFG